MNHRRFSSENEGDVANPCGRSDWRFETTKSLMNLRNLTPTESPAPGVSRLLFWLFAFTAWLAPTHAALPPTLKPNAQLEEIYAADKSFEGPTWDPKTQKLFFTAFGKEKADTQILRLDGGGKATVWLDQTEGVNGTFLSHDGRLLGAQAFGHRVVRYDIGMNGPKATTVLLHAPKLNQPNDLCEASNGNIYFTDPDFAKRSNSAVFLLKPGGQPRKIISDMPLPNGLKVSLDGKTLVVSDSAQKRWRSYPIRRDGTVGKGRVFFDPPRANRAETGTEPDGLCLDEQGNFYLTGRHAVWVVSPQGQELGSIPVQEFCSNVCFGGADGQSLFLTCEKKVYRLAMRVRGASNQPFLTWNHAEGTRPPQLTHGTYRSAAMGVEVGYSIWLPPDYATNAMRRYPVLYWLHGLGGTENGDRYPVETLARAVERGEVPPMILVQPNGGALSVYADSANGRWLAETTFIRELIPHVDATYRTSARREFRAIQGMSMGGEGALRFALKYPELFSSVVAYAGGYVSASVLAEHRTGIYREMFASNASRYEKFRVPRYARRNADRVRGRVAIRLVCGTQDDQSLPLSREIHELLAELNVPHDSIEVPGARHDVRPLVERPGADDLNFMTRHFSPSVRQP